MTHQPTRATLVSSVIEFKTTPAPQTGGGESGF